MATDLLEAQVSSLSVRTLRLGGDDDAIEYSVVDGEAVVDLFRSLIQAVNDLRPQLQEQIDRLVDANAETKKSLQDQIDGILENNGVKHVQDQIDRVDTNAAQKINALETRLAQRFDALEQRDAPAEDVPTVSETGNQDEALKQRIADLEAKVNHLTDLLMTKDKDTEEKQVKMEDKEQQVEKDDKDEKQQVKIEAKDEVEQVEKDDKEVEQVEKEEEEQVKREDKEVQVATEDQQRVVKEEQKEDNREVDEFRLAAGTLAATVAAKLLNEAPDTPRGPTTPWAAKMARELTEHVGPFIDDVRKQLKQVAQLARTLDDIDARLADTKETDLQAIDDRVTADFAHLKAKVDAFDAYFKDQLANLDKKLLRSSSLRPAVPVAPRVVVTPVTNVQQQRSEPPKEESPPPTTTESKEERRDTVVPPKQEEVDVAGVVDDALESFRTEMKHMTTSLGRDIEYVGRRLAALEQEQKTRRTSIDRDMASRLAAMERQLRHPDPPQPKEAPPEDESEEEPLKLEPTPTLVVDETSHITTVPVMTPLSLYEGGASSSKKIPSNLQEVRRLVREYVGAKLQDAEAKIHGLSEETDVRGAARRLEVCLMKRLSKPHHRMKISGPVELESLLTWYGTTIQAAVEWLTDQERGRHRLKVKKKLENDLMSHLLEDDNPRSPPLSPVMDSDAGETLAIARPILCMSCRRPTTEPSERRGGRPLNSHRQFVGSEPNDTVVFRAGFKMPYGPTDSIYNAASRPPPRGQRPRTSAGIASPRLYDPMASTLS